MGRAKRIISLMLAAVMCVSMCACNKADKGGEEGTLRQPLSKAQIFPHWKQ